MSKNLIGTLLALITIIGAAFTVDGVYVRKAEAADAMAAQFKALEKQSAIQERDKIEVELQVIRLELEFLTEQYQDAQLDALAKEKILDRKQYLRKREEILEARQLALRDKL